MQESEIEVISTSGKDFVTDLNSILTKLQDSVFVTSGDIPLLDEKIIKEIVDNYDSKNVWTSIMITQTFLNSLAHPLDHKIVILL